MVNENPIILALETCSEICSVALFKGSKVLANQHVLKENSHSALLTPLIEDTLKKAGIEKKELTAIAVGMGPGSYTGLRVGLSTAKGLAYALNIPIIPVDTLTAMAYGMKMSLKNHLNKDSILIPMIEARRMEVYSAGFNLNLDTIFPPQPIILDDPNSNNLLISIEKGLIGGNGAIKCLENPTLSHLSIISEKVINALNYGEISNRLFKNGVFVDTAYSEPFYLKSPPLKKPKKLI
ncbi:MAG: tRNA threonylcarbamoyladenosine biosynthesis protein TsaB [Sphingobacteriales bacterium]|jgi:tRNA threonylcarbamoyladenosine biosynthesis protein TsaB